MIENPFPPTGDDPTEFKLHMAIKKHYDACFIGAHNPSLKIMHIANENRDSTQGHFNKMLGVHKGFPDLLAGWPHKNIGVCEIKLPGNKLTKEQEHFMIWAKAVGWHTGVARSVQQAHHLFCIWGLKPAFSYKPTQEPDQRSDMQKKHDVFEMYRP